MDAATAIIIIVIGLISVYILLNIRRVIVYEYDEGYDSGKGDTIKN